MKKIVQQVCMLFVKFIHSKSPNVHFLVTFTEVLNYVVEVNYCIHNIVSQVCTNRLLMVNQTKMVITDYCFNYIVRV